MLVACAALPARRRLAWRTPAPPAERDRVTEPASPTARSRAAAAGCRRPSRAAPARRSRPLVARAPSSTRSIRELRRRQRRRHRRPRRRPVAARLPARPRGRRHLVHPWYVSPLADGGYDVADYRAIDPPFGTLDEAEPLIAEALDARDPHDHRHRPEPRVRPAPVVPGGARRRARARPSATASGSARARAPTAARCRPAGAPTSGRPTWTRTTNPDGSPGEWYLHLFSAEQPDLNWDHPDVRAEHEDILRFWFDRGAAGVRIDSAALLVKDAGAARRSPADPAPGEHPTTDRDELHDIYRGWRAIADAYPGTRVLVGEVWLPDVDRFARYLRPDELHTAFNFDFLARPWDAAALRASIDATLAAHAPVGAPRPGCSPTTTSPGRSPATAARTPRSRSSPSGSGMPTDVALGRRRARAAALLTAALPGSLYIYQGDELGLRRGRGPARRARSRTRCTSGRRRRPGPRRLPGAAAVVGRPPPFGFSPAGATRRAVAAASPAPGRR